MRGSPPDRAALDAFIAHARGLPKGRVLNVRDFPGGLPEDAVYIGRGGRYGGRWYPPSRWRNPYKVGRDGDRSECIERFGEYMCRQLGIDPDWLAPLRGKRLVCHCHPLACHGDEIVKMLQQRYGDES